MQLEAREKRFLIGGSIIAVLLLAYLLWPSSRPTASAVELVSPEERSAAGGASPPPPPTTGPPVQVTTVAAPPAMVAPPQTTVPPPPGAGAPTPPGTIPQGLTLTGIAGDGAIFAAADGTQRYVARGREVAPGVTLQSVSLRFVLLAAGTTNYRLGFGGQAVPLAPPSSPAAVAPPQPSIAR